MPSRTTSIDRRTFMRGASVLSAGAVGVAISSRASALAAPTSVVTAHAVLPTLPTQAPALWHNPSSWANGRVPGRGDVALVDRPITLEGLAEVAGVRIEASGSLLFAPAVSATLRSWGNVVVRGALVLRPQHGLIKHTVTFLGIDERRFVGGGMDVLESDIGLWIVEHGILDAVGTPKDSWTNLSGAAAQGARTLTLKSTKGWLVGDRIVVTPTIAPVPSTTSLVHATAYDDATATVVAAGTVSLNKALSFAHPAVADSFGNRWTAEALNLTRNVVIEGTVSGRAHVVFLHCRRPQSLSDVELRHLGPRESYANKNGKIKAQGVLGRYPLHFHMMGDHSVGSVIRNVVVHDSGNHAFVPHESHGMTFDGCVSHDTFASPYWWDVADRGVAVDETHDLLLRGCVGSFVRAEQSSTESYRLTAFQLGKGDEMTNRAERCVAVGVDEGNESSGFTWPERSRGVWGFADCIAHNNVNHGILSWQNTEDVSVIGNFTAYHNGGAGILHGAYSNFWKYHDCDLYANRQAGLLIQAVTRRTKTTMRYYPKPYPVLTFERMRIDGGGLSLFGIASGGHRFAATEGAHTLVANCDVRNAAQASFMMGPWANREEYDILDCRFGGRHFQLDKGMNPTSYSRVRNLNGDKKLMTVWLAGSKPGAARPDWNATVVAG